MSKSQFARIGLSIFVGLAVLIAVVPRLQGQDGESARSGQRQSGAKAYESGEIKLRIPNGWNIQHRHRESVGALFLEKDGFTLSLAYHAGQASGIVGGRFEEILNVPWEREDAGVACSGYLQRRPWPASRNLIFINLILQTGDPTVQKNCDIPKELGGWTVRDGLKLYDGDERWVAGYFAAEYGGYFFGGDGADCGEKAYTLTPPGNTPEKLPVADIPNQNNDPALEKIIEEAIDIVNSIHYTRCNPF